MYAKFAFNLLILLESSSNRVFLQKKAINFKNSNFDLKYMHNYGTNFPLSLFRSIGLPQALMKFAIDFIKSYGFSLLFEIKIKC
jgi:hypothetical protein